MKRYDVIFVGTGIIPILEAVYQSRCGKNVLMLDEKSDLGGAWASLELFGLKNVENAIHYFMPDPKAFELMRDVLGWDVIQCENKFRTIAMPFNRYWNISYDNNFGRLISRMITAYKSPGKKWAGIFRCLTAIKDVIFEDKQNSHFVRGGAKEILQKVRKILDNSNVEIKFSTKINKFHINKENKLAEVHAGKEVFHSNAVCFTHGSRIPQLTSPSGLHPINEKEHLRPAAHILVNDDTPTRMYESVFVADSVIKYIHDISKYTDNYQELAGNKKLFVFALQSDVVESEEIYHKIFMKMKKAGIIGSNSTIDQRCWWTIYLPRLYDEDLQGIKDEFGQQVEILKTESMSRGIGIYAERWASKFKYSPDET